MQAQDGGDFQTVVDHTCEVWVQYPPVPSFRPVKDLEQSRNGPESESLISRHSRLSRIRWQNSTPSFSLVENQTETRFWTRFARQNDIEGNAVILACRESAPCTSIHNSKFNIHNSSSPRFRTRSAPSTHSGLRLLE